MVKYKIVSLRAGFGVTILSKEPGGNVLKYYLEPEIQMEIPAEANSESELQEVLDKLGSEILGMVQKSVKAKAISDKQKKQEG